MSGTTYRPPYTREDFEKALAVLRKGQIPDGMSELTAYINHTTKELVDYALAVTECAVRQAQKIDALELAVARTAGAKKEGTNGRSGTHSRAVEGTASPTA